MFKIIISIVLTLAAKAYVFAQSSNLDYFIKPDIQEYKYTGDRSEELTGYSIRGLVDAEFYDITYGKESFGINKGLGNFDSRKQSYKRVLRHLAFQTEFKAIDMMYLAEGQAETSESDLFQFHIPLMKELGVNDLGDIMDEIVMAIPGVNDAQKYAQHLNNVYGSGAFKKFNKSWFIKSDKYFRKETLNNFSAALEAINLATNVYTIFKSGDEIYYTYMLLDALKADIALQRMEFLWSMNISSDPAYRQALSTVITDLKQIPSSTWSQITTAIKLRPEEKIDIVFATGSAANSAAALFTKASPVLTGWITAILFAAKTINEIQEWNQNLRDAATAANLYSLISKSQNATNIYADDMIDYSQFLFYKSYSAIMNQKNLKVWESRNKNAGQQEVRIYIDDRFKELTRLIALKRAASIKININNGSSTITLCFLIDSSSSMEDTDPNNIRVEATKLIVDYLDGSENIFIIDFDNTPKWKNSSNYTKFNATDLKQVISQIDAHGGTEIGRGISGLQKILETQNFNPQKTGVLLLSDGKSPYNQEAAWFAAQGIPIYTISYKNMGDASLLNKIAQETNGLMVQADNEDDIVAAFLQFYNKLAGQNTYFQYSAPIADLKQNQVQYFTVDPGTTTLYGNLSWNYGENMSMELESPLGIPYRETGSGGTWKQGNNYSSVQIIMPAAGQWKVTISGNAQFTFDTQASYIFESGGKSPIALDLSKTRSATGEVNYKIEDTSQQVQLANSTANVTVTIPSGKVIDISSAYKGGAFSFLPAQGIGSYKYRIDMKAKDKMGNPVQRVFTSTDLVGEIIAPYIAQVTNVQGNFITAPLGEKMGNFNGMKAFIYKQGSSKSECMATGYVTMVTPTFCTIEIQEVFRSGTVMNGDIVELDNKQWVNNKSY